MSGINSLAKAPPLGEVLKKFRKSKFNSGHKPLSQLELALLIGWENPSSISRIESGEVKPTRETIIKIGNALNLSNDEINVVLKIAGYVELQAPIDKKFLEEFLKNIDKDFSKYSFPIILLDDKARVVYWNDFTSGFFFEGLDIDLEEIVNNTITTHVDLIFDPKFDMFQRTVNKEEFFQILVENCYYHYSVLKNNSIEHYNWLKYPEFKRLWILCEKEKTPKHSSYNIPFIYNHKDLGEVHFKVSTFHMFEDNRFYVEQFMPARKEDENIIISYLNRTKAR